MINIKDALYKAQQEKEKEEYTGEITMAPSYLADCRRKIFYKKTNTEQTNPPDLPAIFKMELGKAGHEKIQDMIIQLGLMVECEVHKEFTDNTGVKYNYFMDGVIRDGDENCILEIKTIYGAGFRFVEQEPKIEHILQCLCYMSFSNITKCILLYVGRDNGFMVQYNLVKKGDDLIVNGESKTKYLDLWQEKMKSMASLKKMIEGNQCPDRDYAIVLKNNKGEVYDSFQKDGQKYKSDWQCSYCPWRGKCWSSVYTEINKHKFYINGEFID